MNKSGLMILLGAPGSDNNFTLLGGVLNYGLNNDCLKQTIGDLFAWFKFVRIFNVPSLSVKKEFVKR